MSDESVSKGMTRTPEPGAFDLHFFAGKVGEVAGQTYITGIATGPAIDLQGEAMAPECVADMVRQFQSRTVPLRPTHALYDWSKSFGVITDGALEASGNASVTVWLDMDKDEARTLVRQLQGRPDLGIPPKQLGLSIGGLVKQGDVRYETRNGQPVPVIARTTLEHVTVTPIPAYREAMIQGVSTKEDAATFRPWVWDVRKALETLPAAEQHGGDAVPVSQEEETMAEKQTDAAPDPAVTPATADVAKADETTTQAVIPTAAVTKDAMADMGPCKWVQASDVQGSDMVCVQDTSAAPSDAPPEDTTDMTAGKTAPWTAPDFRETLKAVVTEVLADLRPAPAASVAPAAEPVRKGVSTAATEPEARSGDSPLSALDAALKSDDYTKGTQDDKIRVLRGQFGLPQ